MDAFRRQAINIKKQVAKQQQAVKKQFTTTGYDSSDAIVIDEVELRRHLQIEKLYKSTRIARDFQKDIIRAAEIFIALRQKQAEIRTKLSEDCYRYGGENYASEAILPKVAAFYGGALKNVVKEHEDFGTFLSTQIIDPLRALSTSAPLEDARNLAQQYSRMRHDAETLGAELSKRQFRAQESPVPENTAKLHQAEAKMQELKASMDVLGKEVASALAASESQQQRLTLQRFVAMVEAEKSFHLRVAAILDDVEAEIISLKQEKESSVPQTQYLKRSEKAQYILAEAIYHFNAASENELSLAAGDYVIVRQDSPSGWSEGECRGKSGWFPTAYVEKRDNIAPHVIFHRNI